MSSRWNAKLDLAIAHRDGYSWLRKREHVGPLTLQRPFYPEGRALPHIYLLHPPGGVVAGDILRIHCGVDAGASALVTTPGAAKFYRARGGTDAETENFADQSQELSVAEGGSLEWMPQESIAFSGAQARLTTRVHLERDSTFAAWDIVCLGRPGCAEPFQRGSVRQSFEISRAGRLLFRERAHFDADAPILAARWGLHGQPVSGVFVSASSRFEAADDSRSGGKETELVALVREAMTPAADEQATVSLMRGVLVCRYLGVSTERAKKLFAAAWRIIRPSILGRTACPPRIWAT